MRQVRLREWNYSTQTHQNSTWEVPILASVSDFSLTRAEVTRWRLLILITPRWIGI